jgi:hypothetical protein
MIPRRALLLILLSATLAGAQAQTRPDAALAYRFVPGKVTQEQMRVSGELRIGSGADAVPLTIDVLTVLRRRVVAVAPSGEGTVAITSDSMLARLSGAGQQIFSMQDRDGISTLVNGVPLTPIGPAPGETTVRIGRGGEMSAVTGAADDPVSRLLNAMPSSAATLPDHSVAIGDHWRASTRMSFPRIESGGAFPGLPELAVTSDSELRSLQTEQGRIVATIVTSSQGTSKDGASKQQATVTSRFDVDAGDLIESDGNLSIDLELGDPADPASAAGKGRLVGRIHFRTTVLSSRVAEADMPPTPGTPAPPTGPQEQSPPPVSLPPAPAGRLGGVDLARYCGEIYGVGASTRLVESSVNGWRCVDASGPKSINVEDACRRQYGSPRAMARYRDFNDANSWECVNP